MFDENRDIKDFLRGMIVPVAILMFIFSTIFTWRISNLIEVLREPTSKIEISTSNTQFGAKEINFNSLIYLINESNNKDFDEKNIYIGKETCPSCKDFEESLKKVKTNKTIFYFDVDKADEEELTKVKEAIASLNLGINSVPTLIKLKGDEKINFKESNKVEKIEKFLNQ